MTATALADPTDLRCSTDEWPESDRRSAVWDLYGRAIWPAEFEPLPNAPVFIDARFRTLPGLRVADVTCTTTRRARRTGAHLSDDFVLHISRSGSRRLSQRGRDVSIGYGEAVLNSGAEPSATTVSPSRFITLRVPAKMIRPLIPDIDDRVARPIRCGDDAIQQLAGYAEMLQDSRAMNTPEMRRLAVKHVYDLIALVLGPSREAAIAAGARAARLRAIQADILGNLGNDLSIAAVAARHRLPVRYVQRLFEAEGSTFTEFVVEQRLLHAHRLLADRVRPDRPIALIAYDSGFGHLPYFNRAFRARFGDSPTGIRAQLRRDPAAGL
jgi:AraC-like DNA-binding protein